MPHKYVIFPEKEIFQDSNQSITTEDGTYDFENFSEHEKAVIIETIKTVLRKYPPIFRAIGLVNESYQIIYKPRYILFEIVVALFSDSNDAMDNLAVAIAYETKGAHFRSEALKHFEYALNNLDSKLLDRFFVTMPYNLYIKFSRLYEKEHDFSKALQLTLKAQQHSDFGPEVLSDRIVMLQGKLDTPPKQRKRKITERDLKLEEKIQAAAKWFIHETKISTK